MDNDKETTDPKQIMAEIHNFYSKLFDKDSYNLGENSIARFLDKMNVMNLSNDQKEVLDKKLTRSELYQALQKVSRKQNTDTRKLPAYIPAFYEDGLDAWSELKNSNVVSYEDVIDQIIWNKKILSLTRLPFRKTSVLSGNC